MANNYITYGDKTADPANPITDASKQWLDEDANEVKTKHNLNDDRITALENKFPIFILQGQVTIGYAASNPVGHDYSFDGGFTSAQQIQVASAQGVIRIGFPDLSTSSYQTLIEVNSLVDPLVDNDITYCVLNKTSTSFDFSVQGTGAGTESILINVTLIGLDLT